MGIKVFLDMDGVIVDFVGGLHKALGVDYNPADYPYEASKYDMFEDLCARTNGRVSMDNLYRACDKAEFWSGLEWDPMGQEILQTIMIALDHWEKDICVCTSPMANPDAWKGKVEWVKREIPKLRHITITTAPKHYLAKPGHILVDDKDSNVEEFRKHGGEAFLVPQPWNKGRGKVGSEFLPELKAIIKQAQLRDDFINNPCKVMMRAFGC